jgi:hypothetical protein
MIVPVIIDVAWPVEIMLLRDKFSFGAGPAIGRIYRLNRRLRGRRSMFPRHQVVTAATQTRNQAGRRGDHCSSAGFKLSAPRVAHDRTCLVGLEQPLGVQPPFEPTVQRRMVPHILVQMPSASAFLSTTIRIQPADHSRAG